MVSDVLWRQIEELPVGDRLDLIDRIESTLPTPPVGERLVPSEFRALLEARSRAIDVDAAGNLDAHQALSQLRAKYA
ncbi:MAG: hypothetical protein LBH48_04585 [Bifidobacteriaceae bacterium]|jgi:hypothetical protein|nr:hypothetical protein [Bifidobacteriaceae bacterium]